MKRKQEFEDDILKTHLFVIKGVQVPPRPHSMALFKRLKLFKDTIQSLLLIYINNEKQIRLVIVKLIRLGKKEYIFV